MTAKTSKPIVSPVTVQELAHWIGTDVSDPLLTPLLASATDGVIRFLGYDLMPRAWTLTLWDWPVAGTRTSPNLSPSPHALKREIELPYAAIVSVESVEVYGQPILGYVVRDDTIVLPAGAPYDRYQDNEAPAIVVEYTAGFDPVPDSILYAIKSLAAFLYEHRGECDVMSAIDRSGAAVFIQPYRKYAVVF